MDVCSVTRGIHIKYRMLRDRSDYVKAKVNKFEEIVRTKKYSVLYKVINAFKKVYQPHACLIKKYDGTLVADTSSTLNRWEQFYSDLLNI